MRDAIRIFKRFLPPYKRLVVFSFFFNILGTIFGLFSFVVMMPILKILLGEGTEAPAMQEVHFSLFPLEIPSEVLKDNLKAYVAQIATEQGVSKTLFLVGVVFILAVVLKTGFTFLGSFMMVLLKNNVVRDIRNNMYSRILALPIGFFTEERKGDIIARFTGDVSEVENSVMTSLDMFFKNPIIILFTILAMVALSWQLSLFIFVLFPVAGAIIGLIGRSLKKRSMRGQNKLGEILSTIEETIGGLRIVKAFNAEAQMKGKQQQQNTEYRQIGISLTARHVLASPISELLGTTVIMIVLWYGSRLILGHSSSLAFEDFIVYLALFYNLLNPTKAFSSAFYSIQKGLASMERIDKVLDSDVTIKSKPNAIQVDELIGSIEYKDVWFKYNNEYVLKNINITVAKGKTIALVGQSGSGKSTLVDLLPRFYDVVKGSILIDGRNVCDIDLKSLRGLLGIVSQEAILFNDTIFNNIAFGNEHATMEQVVEAAKVANAHEFIMQTPLGYETNIGDRGAKLSGGQRQRLSIARAILKNPPILILDEATSALDTESERLVQDALTRLMQNRTSIVIAHRLSTIVHADEIIVLRNGEIVERGMHNELLDQKGEYYKFYQLQNFDN